MCLAWGSLSLNRAVSWVVGVYSVGVYANSCDCDSARPRDFRPCSSSRMNTGFAFPLQISLGSALRCWMPVLGVTDFVSQLL